MIITDFKIAVRNIVRNKVHSVISILGLGIGLGSIILLMALIVHETSFNRFIPGYRNLYRVIFGQYTSAQGPLAEAMKKDFPEVKGFFRFDQNNSIQVRTLKDESARNQRFAFSDTSIYRILGLRLISGVPANTVGDVALSKKAAMKFFGSISPLGEVVKAKINDKFMSLSVSGVYDDFPGSSTLYADFIANIKLSEVLYGQINNLFGEYAKYMSTELNWENIVYQTYVVLDKNTDKTSLISKMQKYTELIKDGNTKTLKYNLQPVSDIHLKSGSFVTGNPFERLGNANELKYYWAISFLILLISVANYIFLTRASTSDRFRELGTRKVLGASRNDLRRQIILESNFITILSLIPASFVIDSGMSFIDNTLNRTLSFDVFSNPVIWLWLIIVVIITGTLSGLSIGFKISRIPSLVLLTGKSTNHTRAKNWDYSFLIFHFSLYIILVVSVICVTKQIRYSQTSIKGINPKNVLISELNSPGLKSSFTAICSEMEKIPGVIKVAGSSFIPPVNAYIPVTLATPTGEKGRFDGLIMGEGMTELLGMEVIEGSSFGPYQTATVEVLFNESAATDNNLKAGDQYLGMFHVRGIVRDFHAHTLHTPINPMVIIQQNPAYMGLLAIKTDGKNEKTIISRLRELYNQIAPDEIFEVRYLTDYINEFYIPEKNQAKIMGSFSLLASVLAIMGLFGIAMISIARKTKEVGLRKVNGASIFEVTYLLNKGFIRWVFVAIVVGIPLSIYIMTIWQKRFAYRTDFNWWIFAVAGISAILIALLTVSWQSWRAATRNPVEALRYE
jgi:putative ABC transport system permease protein